MKPPKAVRTYCEEFDESLPDVAKYILDQIKVFDSIPIKAPGATAEQWVGFKLNCSSAAARRAMDWAHMYVNS